MYRIPFSLINCNKQSNNLIQNIFDNLAYVNLTIGTPSQKIPFQLNVNSQAFYLSHNYFNPSLSSTYELVSNEEKMSFSNEEISGFKAKDILNFNNTKNTINFIFENKNQKDNNLSNIGLMIPNRIQDGIYPFFTSLKKAGLINSYSWTLKYFNNISLYDTIYGFPKENKIIGEFIIGDDPHNYEENKTIYNENEFIKINAMPMGYSLFWDMNFDLIYMQFKDNSIIDSTDNEDLKIIIEGKYFTEINLDIAFIVAPSEFFRAIQTNFFNKFRNTCREKALSDTLFRYIECDNNEEFNITSFPDIYFDKKDLETIFNLTYKDLFVLDENNNKYIFLIFNNRWQTDWIFGNIFLKKYQLTFNVDSKTIGYYKSMNTYKENIDNEDNNEDEKEEENEDNNKDKKEEENENNKNDNKDDNNNNKDENNNNNTSDKEETDNNSFNNNNNNKNNIFFYIIGAVIFIGVAFLFVLFGMFIQKRCNIMKRRKRINELEDEDNDFDGYDKDDNLLNKSKKDKNKNKDEYIEINNNIN